MNETINYLGNDGMEPVSYKKRQYRERKDNHLCVSCGRANETEKVCCPECRARESENKKQDRMFYAGLGLCSRCGKNRVFRSEKMCPECKAKAAKNAAHRVKTDGQRERENAWHRRRYQECLAQGTCVKCGRLKAVPGKSRCGICAQKQSDRERLRRNVSGIPRAERYQHGLCYTCGSSLDMDDIKVCSRCYADLKKARAANKDKLPWRRDNEILFFRRPKSSRDIVAENARIIFKAAPYAGAFQNHTQQLGEGGGNDPAV